jgi:hypothetical protein
MLKNLLIFIVFFSYSVFAQEKMGTICLGKNLAFPADEHTNRLYLTIDNSEKIYFIYPYAGPRIISENLNLVNDHYIKVYFDGAVAQSWKVNFTKSKTIGFIVHRTPGAWHSEPIDPLQCK